MKRFFVSFLLALTIVSNISNLSYAKVIWMDGRNKVTSDEIGDLVYNGSMILYPGDELRGNPGRYAYTGWIEYS